MIGNYLSPFVSRRERWAVRWYCKYGVSYRNPEGMLEERGVKVDHITLDRWGPALCARHGAALALILEGRMRMRTACGGAKSEAGRASAMT